MLLHLQFQNEQGNRLFCAFCWQLPRFDVYENEGQGTATLRQIWISTAKGIYTRFTSEIFINLLYCNFKLTFFILFVSIYWKKKLEKFFLKIKKILILKPNLQKWKAVNNFFHFSGTWLRWCTYTIGGQRAKSSA